MQNERRSGWQAWTPEDRERLRELAQSAKSDRWIARQMGRAETAVSWQRRYLRIRLGGDVAAQRLFSAGERVRRGQMEMIGCPRKLVSSAELDSRLEQMMMLSGRVP